MDSILNPTSAGFGAESFVHAGLDFLSVTISCCLPCFDGPHDFVWEIVDTHFGGIVDTHFELHPGAIVDTRVGLCPGGGLQKEDT